MTGVPSCTALAIESKHRHPHERAAPLYVYNKMVMALTWPAAAAAVSDVLWTYLLVIETRSCAVCCSNSCTELMMPGESLLGQEGLCSRQIS